MRVRVRACRRREPCLLRLQKCSVHERGTEIVRQSHKVDRSTLQLSWKRNSSGRECSKRAFSWPRVPSQRALPAFPAKRKKICDELMTSDRTFKASREGSQ